MPSQTPKSRRAKDPEWQKQNAHPVPPEGKRDRFSGQPSRSPHFILKASKQSKFTTGYIAYSLHRICPKIPRGELENVDEPQS